MIVAMKSPDRVETAYQGRLFTVQVLSWTDERGQQIKKEVVRHPGAVLIVPLVDAHSVIMIQNARAAVGERLWEFPAGKLEPGEPPQRAAQRELEEETGYAAAEIVKLGEFYTSPGFTNELMHVFLAQRLSFVGQRLEAGEEIETSTLPLKTVVEMVRSGKIRDGKSVAALQLLQCCCSVEQTADLQSAVAAKGAFA